MIDHTPEAVEAFITRWEHSGAAERANYQMFLAELCDILDVPRPDPTTPDPEGNRYVFDRAITRGHPDGTASTNYIDFYKAAHFVWETKQGVGPNEKACSGGVSPSAANEKALPLDSNGIDGHRQPLQASHGLGKSGHGRRGSAAFDRALERAYNQARDYITHLPASHGRPPFLVVCDVGHSIDLYSEFTCTGGRYERFPDPKHHRILLTDLRKPEIRDRLRLVFTDPHALDPSKVAAKVTRDIATRLAKLAKSLETDGHDPQVIAGFLQRCLFTMFAEDIGLLPEDGFKNLVEKSRENPQGFPVLISALWREMATGTSYSALLFKEIAYFNGGLFDTTTALPLSLAQIDMLADAAASDWSGVEPSIFGTLLTRALDSRERHKLGAEYTPRSYVERLIRPTILDPLREEWDATRIAAATLHSEAEALETQAARLDEEIQALGLTAAAKKRGADRTKALDAAKKKDAEALALVTAFHRHLCSLKFLDPACGTANFLYVTLEHMKRLEAEVLELIDALGGDATFEMNEYKVRPEQFLGLELSPNAVAIAQLVLWIGYFQWQRKTTGKADTGDRPLLPKTHTIRQQDAVLAYDERIPRKDPDTGEILTIWDGHTTKPHPVTGKEVPDESARAVLFDYLNPRRAEWPQADYIVGNPPFIGTKRMIDALGDGYTEALRKAWKGDVPESADLVMFWWAKAAAETAQGRCKRFGFITTNSIHQTFNRRVIEPFVAADCIRHAQLHLAYAIPDHPWIDSADGAAVRIAMTVAAPGKAEGILEKVTAESPMEHGENDVSLSRIHGVIAPNLQVGADLGSVAALQSNEKVAGMGVALHGAGFILDPELANTLRTSGASVIKSYLGGADLMRNSRERYLIDFSFMTADDARVANPSAFQHVVNHVKPERDQNRRAALKDNWWKFGWERPVLRKALVGLSRYIGTTETSKHRAFQFIPVETLADHMIVCVASDDAFHLGVLSSSIHVTWALAAGGRLGMGNDPRYNKSRCFDPFPFPAVEEGPLKQRIRDLGERLDAHRKRQQELHPGLTLTGIYNVLEKLRANEPLTAKDKTIHEQGLVTLLKQLHDDLDDAVLEAYGWQDLTEPPHSCGGSGWTANETRETRSIDLTSATRQECRDSLILTRLVALNHARAAEEKFGHIRWLRPEYQNRSGDHRSPQPEQKEIDLGQATSSSSLKTENSKLKTPAWPERLPAQVTLIRHLFTPDPTATPEQLSANFGRKNAKRQEQIEGIIETLRGLGQV